MNTKSKFDYLTLVSCLLLIISGLLIVWIGNLNLSTWIKIGISVIFSSTVSLAGIIIRYLRKIIEQKNLEKIHIERLSENLNSLSAGLDVTAKVITDVKSSELWSMLNGTVFFYNALWTLPEGIFQKTFQYVLEEKKTEWKVVSFIGINKNEKQIADRRKERMVSAIKKIVLSNQELGKQIEIKESKDKRLPPISFFLFEDNEKRKVARIYISKLLDTNKDIPRIAFDIYDKTIYDTLKVEFENNCIEHV